ncbi:YueH family protein, partial [Staphylococcus succinus]|uniref:YueH family protein n=1 Tax=Staphylococcus succinus TaxID=61015 RepID=UPI003B980798
MKNLVVSRMKIRDVNFNNVRSHVYIYENIEDALYLIAIPELNWSLEVDIT